MAVTLIALYKRPEGGEDGLRAFLARYRAEHLPLMAQVPGLRSTEVEEVTDHYAGEDFAVVTRMTFDDQEALDVAMASPEMRAAGRNLNEFARGLLTLVAVGGEIDHEAIA